MERLTKKIDSCTVFPEELVGETLVPDNPIMCKMLLRLAAYEDTEREPEEVTALQKDWSDPCTVIGECGGIDRLRELAKADEDRRMAVSCWIPVTERLPEDSVKECIIFVPHIPENIVGLGRYLGSGRWVLDGWYLTPEAVTYWMPMPEAPHKNALEAMKDG